jgi:twitching motility protein PilT
VDKGASDLHLKASSKPVLRINGVLARQNELEEVTESKLEMMFEFISTNRQRDRFYSDKELDFHYTISDVARFRVSVLRQRGSLSLAFRVIPYQIPSIDLLELPEVYKDLAFKPRGLVFVTGPTGSGKSTTLAAMIQHLNENEKRIIITVEDPIEYLHSDQGCIINQRSVGEDTTSFRDALIHALRHDPDVIVLGEMRDIDTIATAITAAETGHLVFATLHTTDAAQTVDRIIDVFPGNQQPQIRLQLSQVLVAVLSQVLVKRVSDGRIAATEIMIVNSAIRNVLREGQSFKIPNIIQISGQEGMHTLDQSLAALVRNAVITKEEAMNKTSHPEQLEKLIYNSGGTQQPRVNGYSHFGDLSGVGNVRQGIAMKR